MDCCVYRKSNTSAEALKRIDEFIERNGLVNVHLFIDKPNCVQAFRALQNCVKQEAVKYVIVAEYNEFGDDELMRIENELFFKRNDAELIVLKRYSHDGRYDILNGIFGFYSPAGEWAIKHGDEMPTEPCRDSKRIPPFGYEQCADGSWRPNPEEAEIIRGLFNEYARGSSLVALQRKLEGFKTRKGISFSTPTIKWMLTYERYIGVSTNSHRYALPSILTYEEWMDAARQIKTKHRKEDSALLTYPFFKNVSSTEGKIAFVDNDTPKAFSSRTRQQPNLCRVDSAVYEAKLCRLINGLCRAQYTLPLIEAAYCKKTEYESLYSGCEDALAHAEHEFDQAFARLCAGNTSDALQTMLDKLSDERYVCRTRLRRLKTEIELYSIDAEKIERFFERGRNIQNASQYEKTYFAKLFIKRVRVKDGIAYATVVSPRTGREIKVKLGGVLYNG